MKNSRKGGISQKLLCMILLPMTILIVITVILGENIAQTALANAKQGELKNVGEMATLWLDEAYPGDYRLEVNDANGGMKLYKGAEDITSQNSIVDRIKDMTGLDVSLVYSDTRILTTIYKDGERVTGTGIAEQVRNALEKSDDGIFYSNTRIGSDNYFTYYLPIYNSDDEKIGSFEICTPVASISAMSWRIVIIMVVLEFVVGVIMTLLILSYNKDTVNALGKLKSFAKEAASGNDAAELDPSVTRRKDEYGEIGEQVLLMQRSLRDTMDKDALTKLYNRRCANRKLDIVISHYVKEGYPYSISIGDIDFFKKVNDTYGHDAGDAVLVRVSSILQKNMKDKGFVARWGGEEFLLVFDKTGLEEAAANLEKILDEIRNTTIISGESEIKITMSFGVTCNPLLNQDELIKSADNRLYYAKTHGRNRICAADEEQA